MTDQLIGVAFVGLGRQGVLNLEAARLLPFHYEDIGPNDLAFITVCTSQETTARAARDRYGFENAVTSIEDVLADPRIDVVEVAIPDAFHHEVASACIRAGKHIYLEKPLAKDIPEAEDLAELARANDTVAFLGLQMRFGAAAQAASHLIRDGGIGEPHSFRLTYLHSGYEDPSRPLSYWRLDENVSAGGALFDLGSHAFDLLIQTLGPVRELAGLVRTYFKERPLEPGSAERGPVGVDDVALALAELDSGVTGTIEISRIATGRRQGPQLEIHGGSGSVAFNGYTEPDGLSLYIKGDTAGLGATGFQDLDLSPKVQTSLEERAQHAFFTAVRSGSTDHIPSFDQGLQIQRLLTKARDSALWEV